MEQVKNPYGDEINRTASAAGSEKPRLLEAVRSRLRFKHYSLRTEQAYVAWIKRYLLFHGKRHPREVGAEEVEAFLSHFGGRGASVIFNPEPPYSGSARLAWRCPTK